MMEKGDEDDDDDDDDDDDVYGNEFRIDWSWSSHGSILKNGWGGILIDFSYWSLLKRACHLVDLVNRYLYQCYMQILVYIVIDVQLRSNGRPYMFACRDRTVLILILALALFLFFCRVLNLYKRFCKHIKDVSTIYFACRRGVFSCVDALAHTVYTYTCRVEAVGWSCSFIDGNVLDNDFFKCCIGCRVLISCLRLKLLHPPHFRESNIDSLWSLAIWYV